MKICNIVFWSRTALDKMQTRTLVNYDKRVLKLTCTLCIKSEIRLKRYRQLHALRHIHKRASRPYCTMQSRKFVIPRCNKLHEIFSHHVGIFAFHGALNIHVNNALLRHLRAHVMINKLRVILRTHACKRFPFRLWYAQPFKCVLYILWNVLPVVLHFRVWSYICGNIVHIKPLQ